MLRQLLVCLLVAVCVSGHMRILEPAGRSSLWRLPEFVRYHPEINTLDDENWCAHVKQFENDTRCGVCGDPLDDPSPRANEHGGRYGKGIIAATYKSGQNIKIHLESHAVVVAHGGLVQVQLCEDRMRETEDCFKPLVFGNKQTHLPISITTPNVDIQTTAKLPDGVTCEHCVLRMHYRGAEYLGICDKSLTCECDHNSGNPPIGMGCSEQVTFRACSDIRIVKSTDDDDDDDDNSRMSKAQQ